MSSRPSVGRIVHFVEGGTHHAAIVTGVYGYDATLVDLEVFPNPHAFFFDPKSRTSVGFSATCDNYTWHWPEPV